MSTRLVFGNRVATESWDCNSTPLFGLSNSPSEYEYSDGEFHPDFLQPSLTFMWLANDFPQMLLLRMMLPYRRPPAPSPIPPLISEECMIQDA